MSTEDQNFPSSSQFSNWDHVRSVDLGLLSQTEIISNDSSMTSTNSQNASTIVECMGGMPQTRSMNLGNDFESDSDTSESSDSDETGVSEQNNVPIVNHANDASATTVTVSAAATTALAQNRYLVDTNSLDLVAGSESDPKFCEHQQDPDESGDVDMQLLDTDNHPSPPAQSNHNDDSEESMNLNDMFNLLNSVPENVNDDDDTDTSIPGYDMDNDEDVLRLLEETKQNMMKIKGLKNDMENMYGRYTRVNFKQGNVNDMNDSLNVEFESETIMNDSKADHEKLKGPIQTEIKSNDEQTQRLKSESINQSTASNPMNPNTKTVTTASSPPKVSETSKLSSSTDKSATSAFLSSDRRGREKLQIKKEDDKKQQFSSGLASLMTEFSKKFKIDVNKPSIKPNSKSDSKLKELNSNKTVKKNSELQKTVDTVNKSKILETDSEKAVNTQPIQSQSQTQTPSKVEDSEEIRQQALFKLIESAVNDSSKDQVNDSKDSSTTTVLAPVPPVSESDPDPEESAAAQLSKIAAANEKLENLEKLWHQYLPAKCVGNDFAAPTEGFKS